MRHPSRPAPDLQSSPAPHAPPRAALRGMAIAGGALALFLCMTSPSLPAALVGPGVEIAAVAIDEDEPTPKQRAKRERGLIRQIQKTLTELGFYTGPIDGVSSERTREAIRLYQKRSNLEVDGRATDDLLDQLHFTEQVKKLQVRLQAVREEQIAAAREALLSQEATRELVEEVTAEVADPTRDSDQCFAAPTARCLLDEAMESAKAIFRKQFRDWVLGEILILQAKAGYSVEALATLRRIDDPRLSVVGLRNVTRAQAEAGYIEEARATAETIPLSWSQAEALATVATAEARRGDITGAREIVDRILAMVNEPTELRRRVATLGRLAVGLAREGEADAANAALEQAMRLVRSPEAGSNRESLLSEIATTLAEMGRVDEALRLLEEVEDIRHHPPVLLAAAKVQAQAGDGEQAITTVSELDEDRYRALILSKIAVAQYRTGAHSEAARTMAQAIAATSRIDASRQTYPKDYALSQIALAMVTIDALPQAVSLAREITDRRLRADVLWTAAAAYSRRGDTAAADKTAIRANDAIAAIRSPLDRAWVLSNLARTHAAAGDREAAQRAFDQALATARDITSPWARTQALTKVAATLIEMN